MVNGEAMSCNRTKLRPLIALVSFIKNIEDQRSNYYHKES